jgi:hypothetical protein
LRRIHEASHLIVGHVTGLKAHYIDARREHARVEMTVPGGRAGVVGYLVTLAASKVAQEKYGAVADDYGGRTGDDQRKIEETARRVTVSESAARQLIEAAYRAARALVDERWDDIEWFRSVLERLGDHIDEDALPRFLRHVSIRVYRRGFIPSDGYWAERGLARPRGYDPETREIDAVLSTGAAVRRQDWDGSFDEVLAMKPENVRLGRLNQGAAVLDSHNWHQGVGAMLGGIVPGSARLANGELTARIKFSRGSELARRVARDLEDGIQIPLSVGYKVHAAIENKKTNPVTRTITDWEPLEVSLVPISAEQTGTGFRSAA